MGHETAEDLDTLVDAAESMLYRHAIATNKIRMSHDSPDHPKDLAQDFTKDHGPGLVEAVKALRKLNPGAYVLCLECGYSATVNYPSDPEELGKKTVEAVAKAVSLEGDLKYLLERVGDAVRVHKKIRDTALYTNHEVFDDLRDVMTHLEKIAADIEEENPRPQAPMTTNPFD